MPGPRGNSVTRPALGMARLHMTSNERKEFKRNFRKQNLKVSDWIQPSQNGVHQCPSVFMATNIWVELDKPSRIWCRVQVNRRFRGVLLPVVRSLP